VLDILWTAFYNHYVCLSGKKHKNWEHHAMQKNLLEYLEYTAARVPQKLALTDQKTSLTFSELLENSRRLGSEIVRSVQAVNRPVAVLTDRDVQSVVGFLGVLQSGNYYVPVDVKMPSARMQALMDQLQPVCMICTEKQLRVADTFSQICPILTQETALAGSVDDNLLKNNRDRVLDVDPAYIIFTSGSTGKPKGIVVSHRSVIDFSDWYADTCGIAQTDVLGNQAPFYFDLSVKDLYSMLKTGASMHILPRKFFTFPMLLMQYLKEQEVTVLSWATSAFHLIANSGVLEKVKPEHLRRVIVGGEALQAKQLNLWRREHPRVQYINLYGPTEVTVDCCYYIIDRDFADTEAIPIGKACENMEVFLLDEAGQPVLPGQPGEICARGTGLAQGYFGDWEKTAAVFTQNPRNPWYPDLIYHTGDMAMQDADGNFVFLSRKDNQIKHGGYRIELGEIETALNSVAEIRAAICFFDPEKDKIHCVYQGDLTDAQLVTAIRDLVPKYMLPNVFHKVKTMQYNANGKIDRNKLKEEYLHAEDPNA